jgi:hypothetical protein
LQAEVVVTAHGGRTYLIELRTHAGQRGEDLAALDRLLAGWRRS